MEAPILPNASPTAAISVVEMKSKNIPLMTGLLILGLMLVPQTSAAGYPGFVNAEADPNGGFSGEMVCMAPGFINCSLAVAAAVGDCESFPVIGEVCVGAGFGAGGHLRSRNKITA